MTNNHHKSKYLSYLLDCIFSGWMFEQWYKDIFQPISIKPWFFLEDLENLKNTWVFELSESSFHKFEKFLFHFITEEFISFFVISKENEFKIAWINFIDFLFDFSIHLFPEFFMFTTELFHKMIELHQIDSFYWLEMFINMSECLIDPWMLIPIVIFLALYFGQIFKTSNDLFMFQYF